MQAQNQGNLEAIKASGEQYIEWSSAPSDGGRGHQSLNGIVRRIGDPFILPDKTRIRFPGDPRVPVGHVANCRCSIITPTRAKVARLIREGKLK